MDIPAWKYVDKCGLILSMTDAWLAGTPDDVVNDPSDPSQPLGLVEIKNPLRSRNQTDT